MRALTLIAVVLMCACVSGDGPIVPLPGPDGGFSQPTPSFVDGGVHSFDAETPPPDAAPVITADALL